MSMINPNMMSIFSSMRVIKINLFYISAAFKCGECGQSFENARELQSHISSHKLPTFKCSVCKVKFGSLSLLEVHLRTHFNYVNYDVCNMKVDVAKMKQHLCGADNHIDCDYCEQKFTSTQQLIEHLKTHNGNTKIYRCSKCSKSFTMEFLAKIHQRYHEENFKPFACSDCSKTFKLSNELYQHKQTHLNKNKGKTISNALQIERELTKCFDFFRF